MINYNFAISNIYKLIGIPIFLLIYQCSLLGQVCDSITYLKNFNNYSLYKGKDFKEWVGDIHYDADGLIWIAAYDKLYTYDGITLEERAETSKHLFGRIFDINDTIFLIDVKNDLTYYPKSASHRKILKANWDIRIANYCKYDDGRIYLANEEGDTYFYNNGIIELVAELPDEFDNPSMQVSADAMCIDQKEDNKIWLYFKNYLHHIDVANQSIESYSAEKAGYNLKNPQISSPVGVIHLKDYVYFGSYDHGLIRFNTLSKKWDNFIPEKNHSRGNYLVSALPFNERFLITGGTISKFFDLQTETFHDFRFRDRGLNHNSRIRKEGDLFYSQSYFGGVSLFSNYQNKFLNGRFSELKPFDANNKIEHILKHENGNLGLISEAGELSIWDPFYCNFKVTHELSKKDFGFSNQQSTSNQIVPAQLSSKYDEDPNFSFSKDSNNNYWVGSKNTLVKYNQDFDTVHYINTVKDFGLGTLGGHFLDSNNDLWLGTEQGILRYNPEKDTYRLFTKRDGLYMENWTKDLVFSEFEDGEMVVLCTSNQSRLRNSNEQFFTVFNKDSLQKKDVLVDAYVNKVEILDSLIYFRNIDFPSIDLTSDEDYFTIYYSGTQYDNGPSINFKYKLEGYDEDWVDGKESHLASYNHVPPGKYKFLLKAYNADNLPGQVYDRMTISIDAEIHETLWFKALLCLLGLGIILFIYRTNTSSIRKQERLRSEFKEQLSQVKLEALRSQMNPHFLFNCLNSIDNFILNNDAKTASEYLGKFSKLIRRILDFSKRNEVLLDEELELTNIYIKMEQMRFDGKFDYNINIDPSIDKSKINIPPMILQPYIENAIWHGLLHKNEKGILSIDLSIEENYLKVIIDDDGIGRERAQEYKSKSAVKRKSHGMKITEDRIRLIHELDGLGGEVETIDKVDSAGNPCGTSVILKLPISLAKSTKEI